MDLWDLYRIDVAEVYSGVRPVRWALDWTDRLLDEPMSRYRAHLLGGDEWRQHLGWNPTAYLLANVVDAVNMNSAITAAHGSKQKPKPPPPYTRPPVEQREPDQPTDLEDVPSILAGLMGG